VTLLRILASGLQFMVHVCQWSSTILNCL